MKKVFAIMMAVLLIGALFISCSQQVEEDRLGSVGIFLQESRSISVDVESDIKPSNLVWYYTAEKTSGFYATGETGLTKVPADPEAQTAEGSLNSGSSLGIYSTGWWNFSFYGFDSNYEVKPDVEVLDPEDPNFKAVYYSKDIAVEVKYEDTNLVDIVLSTGTIDNGKVVFKNLSVDLRNTQFKASGNGSLYLTISQDSTPIVTFVSSEKVSTAKIYNLVLENDTDKNTYSYEVVNPGTYNFVFSVAYEDGNLNVPVAKEILPATVNKGTIVTFSGDVLKTDESDELIVGTITGETKAEAEIAATEVSEPVKVIVSVSPASASDADAIAETIVEFAANSIPAAVSTDTYTLKTEVTGIEEAASSDSTFVVTGSAGAVAAIDLSLYKNEETTPTGLTGDATVTITTYIAKGLTTVVVYYDGSPISEGDYSYDAVTGKLVFETDHFSTFAVGADQNVYDKTTNTAYKISERDDDTKGFLLDADNEVVEAVATHDYALLDSSLSNVVADSIDNYNAGYNWSVIYKSDDEKGRVNHDLISGGGSKVDPYSISSGEQWANLISSYYGYELANVFGVNSAPAMYLVLAGEIKMSGYDLSSYTSELRNLHLDGKGNKMSGLTTTVWGYYGDYYDKCEIKNITIEDSYAKYSIFGYGPGEYVNTRVDFTNVTIKNSEANGGLFMYYTGGADIAFENCIVKNSLVHGPSNMAGGGFVGNGQGITINNCKFGGSIVAESENIVGGFVGQGIAIITNSEITEGSVIRSIAANGKVAAYDGQGGGEREGDNNTFNGVLSCDNESNAKKQKSGATWEQYIGLSVSDFALADDGTISYVGATPIPFAKITISESLFQRSEYYKNGDSGQEGKNAYILGGYSCYWEDLIKVDVDSVTLYKVDKVKSLVNVVSGNDSNYASKIAFATTEVPNVNWTRYGSYLDRTNGILYYDGRDSRADRCSFIGQSADVLDASTGELTKVENPYGDFYIVIKAYDQNGGIIGSVTLSYKVYFE